MDSARNNNQEDEDGAVLFRAALTDAFNAFRAAGRTARLWWRDDDATRDGPALQRLLAIEAPKALAVIPARVDQSLASALRDHREVSVFLHGWAHANHAPRGQGLGAWELGLHRPETEVLGELDHGRSILSAMFGAAFVPAVVPPWNRVDPGLFPAMAARGYAGVTLTREPIRIDNLPTDFRQVTSHFDPLRWKEKPARFVGWRKAAERLTDLLSERRAIDDDRPVGLITHHAAHDDATWRFLDTLADVVDGHPAAAWADPAALFGAKDQ